ncbi:hypothetical protein FRC03_007884 [Tulasnella sp. 419]|nr:hypothetical protein FRC03_007884 [Tulasnella sp. 419]
MITTSGDDAGRDNIPTTPIPPLPLEIPELLEIIVVALSFRDLYRCIFVCRDWAEVATRDLWRRGPIEFSHLLQILGPIEYRAQDKLPPCWVYDLAENSLEISSSRWERFCRHARFVRHLRFNRELRPSPMNFRILKVLKGFHGGDVFPQVQRLTIMSEEGLTSLVTSWSFLIPNHTVRSLEVSYHLVQALHPLLSLMIKASPGLRALQSVISTSLGNRTSEGRRVVPVVPYHEWSNLTSFRMTQHPITGDTLLSLSQCPKLRVLEIEIIDLVDRNISRSLQDFEALEDLNIKLWYLDEDLIECFARFTTSALRELKARIVSYRDQGTFQEMQSTFRKFFEVVSSRSAHVEGVEFYLSGRLTPEVLTPLKGLSQLKHLSISAQCDEGPEDQSWEWLKDLSPTIQRLFIDFRIQAIPMQILISIARSCPDLHFCHLNLLEIGENVLPIPNLPKFGAKLRYLDVGFGNGIMSNLEELARTLAFMVPTSTKVQFLSGSLPIRRFNALRNRAH